VPAALTGRIVMNRWLSTSAAALTSIGLLSAFQAPTTPEAQLAGIARTYLGMGLPPSWEGIEKLPHIRWASPTTSLEHCLPDGGCYARQGTAVLGGRKVTVMATGARTMAVHIYFRNPGAALGEAKVVAALKEAGLGAGLARCPVRAGAGGTNWYRLSGPGLEAGYLSIQAATAARPTEGFVLSPGEDLPSLQPDQVARYSEKCAPGAERTPVSTSKPHERLAQIIVTLLPPTTGPAVHDWSALGALPVEITWNPGGPKPADLSTPYNDPSPLMQSGAATWAGRKFSLMASGLSGQVKTIYLEEQGMHPRGEHMLGVVYEKGIAVQLVRCGPVYTESTNNWYRLTSPRTRPVMIRQSIRYDGNQVQDSYVLRLDDSLPARDPRDRDPGVNGC
jgi:hypothetical protein